MPQHECSQLPQHTHPRTEWTWCINAPSSFRQIALRYGSPTGSLSPPARLNPHHPQRDNILQVNNTALVSCLPFPASLSHSPGELAVTTSQIRASLVAQTINLPAT